MLLNVCYQIVRKSQYRLSVDFHRRKPEFCALLRATTKGPTFIAIQSWTLSSFPQSVYIHSIQPKNWRENFPPFKLH